MSGRLAGRVGIVSGGAGGAGRASARRFAAEGARVAIFDVQDRAGAAVAEEIRAGGGDALFAACDVSDEAAVADAFATVDANLGPPDVLFNHAGTVLVKRLVDMSVDEWDRADGGQCAEHVPDVPRVRYRGWSAMGAGRSSTHRRSRA